MDATEDQVDAPEETTQENNIEEADAGIDDEIESNAQETGNEINNEAVIQSSNNQLSSGQELNGSRPGTAGSQSKLDNMKSSKSNLVKSTKSGSIVFSQSKSGSKASLQASSKKGSASALQQEQTQKEVTEPVQGEVPTETGVESKGPNLQSAQSILMLESQWRVPNVAAESVAEEAQQGPAGFLSPAPSRLERLDKLVQLRQIERQREDLNESENRSAVEEKELPSFSINGLARSMSRLSTQSISHPQMDEMELGTLVRSDSPSGIHLYREKQIIEQEKEPSKSKLASRVSLVPVEPTLNRDDILLQFQSLLDRREKGKSRNIYLQNKLGEYFRRKRPDDSRDTERSASDHELRYNTYLSMLRELDGNLSELNTSNNAVVSELKFKLEEKRNEAEARSNELVKFKRNTAVNSENSRTGKEIPLKVIEQLEHNEQRKEQEVINVRLENIKLRNKLRRQEQLLRQKEELADGLHLIDFEQLKIENQAYNEKIEERNEELLKLRKKITNIVQVLTHVKEKLQFVQNANNELKSTLDEHDARVNEKRDRLPLLKSQRDQLRSGNVHLRQSNGLLGNEPLLRDFETKKDASEELNITLQRLQTTYAQVTIASNEIKRKIQNIKLDSRKGQDVPLLMTL